MPFQILAYKNFCPGSCCKFFELDHRHHFISRGRTAGTHAYLNNALEKSLRETALAQFQLTGWSRPRCISFAAAVYVVLQAEVDDCVVRHADTAVVHRHQLCVPHTVLDNCLEKPFRNLARTHGTSGDVQRSRRHVLEDILELRCRQFGEAARKEAEPVSNDGRLTDEFHKFWREDES